MYLTFLYLYIMIGSYFYLLKRACLKIFVTFLVGLIVLKLEAEPRQPITSYSLALVSVWYLDNDHDGYGDKNNFVIDSVAPANYVSDSTDCNDQDSSIHPGAQEICNNVDDDCNGLVDDGITFITYYIDNDHDGYGSSSDPGVSLCQSPGDEYSVNNSDCNDNNSDIHPFAVEQCNGIDDNCNGIVDDNVLAAEINIIWQKTFGGSNADVALAMDTTLDHGYVIAGYTSSSNGDVTLADGNLDFWVVKIDSNGTLLWQKTFGGSNAEVAYAIGSTADGGYIVAGSTLSANGDVVGNHGSDDVWVIKLNSSGNLIWKKCYGGSGSDAAYAMDKTSDGGAILAGYTKSSNGNVTGNHLSGDYWILKIDRNGVLQWQKTYGGSAYDFAHAVTQSADGGYVVSGYARSNDGDVLVAHGQEDMWILKLDSLGNMVWQKSYGGTGGEGANCVQQTQDRGYILAGVTHSFNIDVVGNHGVHDVWVVKIDSLGNLQWSKCLGGSQTDNGNWIETTSDGGYLVAGFEESTDGDVTFNNGHHDYWVVKLNSSGSIEWQRSLGGSQDDEANAILPIRVDDFIVAGFTNSNDDDVSGNHGNSDFWIVKCVTPALNTFYADSDGDGFGNPNVFVKACVAPPGYVANSGDCNDSNALINPEAPEICNGIDDNCNGQIDENALTATITPLVTTTLCSNSTITFQCNTNPAYTYQWLKNGVAIHGATNSSYTTKPPGNFSVTIKNGNCSATSAQSIVKAASTPTVTPAGTITVCSGASVTFSTLEAPGMTYQWKNASGNISGATNLTYTTTSPGSYSMVKTDIDGCTVVSAKSTLKNYAAVSVSITASGSLKICSTGSVTFTASASAGYTYVWYKNGSPIPGATNISYTATQAGAYKVLATTTDGCSKFSTAKTVTGCKADSSLQNDNTNPVLLAFPNPSDGHFTCSITTTDSYNGDADIALFNLVGQLVIERKVKMNDGRISEEISLPLEAPAGVYFLKVIIENRELASSVSVIK